MMKIQKHTLGTIFAAGLICILSNNVAAESGDYLLIDDFSSSKSRLGTSWEGFSDQVMGGRSEISVSLVPKAEEPYIRMTGDVSLERNGGFIQTRLKLTEQGSFDASDYSGIRLKARGRDKGYYIFLRTASTILPWKFYKAQFDVSQDWQYIDIPWAAFENGDYGRLKKLNIDKLKSLALTAYAREFSAELEVSEIGLYR